MIIFTDEFLQSIHIEKRLICHILSLDVLIGRVKGNKYKNNILRKQKKLSTMFKS